MKILKRLIGLVSSAYRAHITKIEEFVDIVNEMDEPLRSKLIDEIFFPER